MEVWHEGKHVSLAQYPLPPRVVSSLVPHLIMVAAVCIEHLGHVIWGRGIQHMSEGMPNAHASLNRLDIVKTRVRDTLHCQHCQDHKSLEGFVRW